MPAAAAGRKPDSMLAGLPSIAARVIAGAGGSGPVFASSVSSSAEVKKALPPSALAPMKAAMPGRGDGGPTVLCDAETATVQARTALRQLPSPSSGDWAELGLRRRYSSPVPAAVK